MYLIGISEGSMCGTTERKVVTLTNCSEPGQHLTECIVTASDSCTTCSYLILTCFTGWCIGYRAVLDIIRYLFQLPVLMER